MTERDYQPSRARMVSMVMSECTSARNERMQTMIEAPELTCRDSGNGFDSAFLIRGLSPGKGRIKAPQGTDSSLNSPRSSQTMRRCVA